MKRNPSREDHLLLKGLRFCFNPEFLTELKGLGESDWVIIADNAAQHGVGSFLWHHLKPHEHSLAIPRIVREKFVQLYISSSAKGMVIRNQLSHLLAMLHDNNIWNVVLKGAFLAEKYYGDFSIRPMTDIDILIDLEDSVRVEELLIKEGYKPKISARMPVILHHFTYTAPKGGLKLEIHHSLLPLQDSLKCDNILLRKRSVKTVVADCQTHALALEDLLLYQCYHLGMHFLLHFGLRSLCDIAMIIRKDESLIDWSVLARHAAKWSGVNSVILAIELMKSLLCVSVPPGYYLSFGSSTEIPFGCDSDFAQLLFYNKKIQSTSKEDFKSACGFLFNIRNEQGRSIIINTAVPPKHVIKVNGRNSSTDQRMASMYIRNTLRLMKKLVRIIWVFIVIDREKVHQFIVLLKLKRWVKLS